MDSNELSQNEADYLLNVPKKRIDNITYLFPGPGKRLHLPVCSTDLKHVFTVDVRPGRIELKRGTCQLRANAHILARVDLVGGLHRNPDGKEVPCPHIHLYQEGFNDQWAFPLPAVFLKHEDLWQTLNDFFEYCNIVDKPYMERGSTS